MLWAPLVLEPKILSVPQRQRKACVVPELQTDSVPHRHLLPETVELLVVKTPAPHTLSVPQRHLVPETVEAPAVAEAFGSNCQRADRLAIELPQSALPANGASLEADEVETHSPA